ncbi:DNA cytosine methyltransferase [Streptomyces hydrogenans]|uniref:DNA cytosine methyltransferase n=1 Tax=Streptomyces hydrogenans TaxID=1873719 RepID=UPI0035D8A297
MYTVTDFFCGAGGSAQGMHLVPGVEVKIAANHWGLAIDSHALNFPEVDHDCADISQIDFRRYPRTDLLWASPECTNHSLARGVRSDTDRQPDLFGEILPTEAAIRSRATMWDVPRYLEAMVLRGRPVLGVVVENVPDLERWVLYPAWRQAVDSLGYELTSVSLNSMHAEPRFGSPRAPQSRNRKYDLLTLKSLGRRPNLEKWLSPTATCPDHGRVQARQSFKNGRTSGSYRSQYVYLCPVPGCGLVLEPHALPAAAAIDWKKKGTRIGDRPRPLAEKTITRIRAGLTRYARPIAVPMEGREGKKPFPLDGEPMRTVTTRNETGIAYLPGEFMPFIAEMRGGGSQKKARGVDEPLATVCASGNHHGLVTGPYVPGSLLVPVGGTWNDEAAPVSDPMRTRTTRETDALLVPYYGNGTAAPTSEPMRTVTTVDRHGLVTAADGLIHGVAVEDCLLRMLEPTELGTAMAFHSTYRLLGTRRERVRQYGNAVTPPASEVLMSALIEAVSGEDL